MTGWHAWISTRFLGESSGPLFGDYAAALHLQLEPPRLGEVVVDLFVSPSGKVLSSASSGGAVTLIGLRPSSWEATFGLPARP